MISERKLLNPFAYLVHTHRLGQVFLNFLLFKSIYNNNNLKLLIIVKPVLIRASKIWIIIFFGSYLTSKSMIMASPKNFKTLKKGKSLHDIKYMIYDRLNF